MCMRPSRNILACLGFVTAALCAGPAAADPVAVSGVLFGNPRFAAVEQELVLTFPDFTIDADLGIQPRLDPGFCSDGCGNGTAVPFTQTTGVFSGHSTGAATPGATDADVTGSLSFVGPTEFVSLNPDFGGDVLSSMVQISGFLRVTQPGRVLFDGTLAGSGLATVTYETLLFGPSDTRLGGYQFAINSVATTPEPSSILLFGSCMAWIASRRRRASPSAAH